MRPYRCEREHMVEDAVTFDVIEIEVASCIVQGHARMRESVESVRAPVPVVPVIQEVVVKQPPWMSEGSFTRSQSASLSA